MHVLLYSSLPTCLIVSLDMESKVKALLTQSCLTLCDPMNYIARQAPLSMEFSRQVYWSGSPFLSPGDLSHPGIESESLALQADSLPSEPPGKVRNWWAI